MAMNQGRIVVIKVDVFVSIDIDDVFPLTGVEEDSVRRGLDTAAATSVG